MTRRSALPTLVALCILVAFAITVLATHAWDPMAFVLDRPQDVPADQTWGIGYDGQQAYAIAVDPVGAASKLDRPAYRYQRIIYPILARLVGFGNPDLIPWSMLIINLISACVTVLVLSQLLVDRGVSGWWSLVPLLSFNYLIGIRMDLNGPLAYALALGGLLSFERKKPALAAVLFALAGLTREVALVFPLALVAWLFLQRRWREALGIASASMVPFVAWSAFVRGWQGASPFATPLARPELIPFGGLLLLEGFEARVLVSLWAVVPALAAGVAAVWDLLKQKLKLESADTITVLASSAVIAFLPAPTWIDPLAILRLAVGLILAIVLWLAYARPSLLPFVAGLWLPSILLVFMIPGFLI
jgi:hypothetical protein